MHRTALSIPPSKPFCHIPFLHHTNRPRHLPKPPLAIPSTCTRLPVHHSRPPKGNRLEMPRSPLRNASLPIPVQPGQQSPGQYPGLYCIQTKAAIRRVRSCLGKLTGKRYLFKTGSQVSPTPSFLNILWSTSLSITVQCTWHPRSLVSCSSARRQLSSFSESTESATSTSSVCSRGLRPPR